MPSQKVAGGFLLMFTMLIATLYTLYYENQIVNLSFQRLQAQYHITRFQNPFSKHYINEKIGPSHEHHSSTNKKASIHRENSDLFLPPNKRFQKLEPQIKQYLSNSTENRWIVLWDAPWGDSHWLPGPVGPECGKCSITYDRSVITSDQPGAVVFHFAELQKNNMPTPRHTNQLYVWWSNEGPRALKQARGLTLQEYDNVFNLTMTYRRDSDVFSPYGYNKDVLSKDDQMRISPDELQERFKEIMGKKKGVVLWIVSNCGDRWSPALGQRLRVSQDLIDAGLYVERKGLCFGGRDDSYKPVDYKFYLSFENQLHCKDYITEKLWKNAFDNDAVPIVWGATKADYEAAAPPNSFIFAEDFTPQELADYIHYLDNNATAYAEYFKWRTLRPEDMSMYGRECWFCQICRILHGVNVDNIYNPNYESKYKDIPLLGYPERPRVVTSLAERFYGTENEDCIAD